MDDLDAPKETVAAVAEAEETPPEISLKPVTDQNALRRWETLISLSRGKKGLTRGQALRYGAPFFHAGETKL